MRIRIIFGFLLLLNYFPAISALTIEEAVQAALKQNPEIQAAKAKWEAAKAKAPKALSLDDPEIGLEYEQIPSGSRNLEDGMKMYKAKQMVMFPGKIYAEWQMARAEAGMWEANYKAKSWEIISQVKAAYFDLFYTERAIEAVTDIQGFLSGIKKSAQAKYVVGNAAQAEVLMANIEELMADNELTTLKQEKPVRVARLESLLNRRLGETAGTEAGFELPPTIEAAAALEEKALNNRPELLAMRADLAAKDFAHLKSKMEYFPDLMLGVKKRTTDGWDAMFSFSVPLYFWKQAYGVSSVGLDRQAAEADYQNMRNMASWMVKENWTATDAAIRTVLLYKEKIVPQSAQALKAALAAYPAGKVDFPILLQAARGYKEARLKYHESQAEYGKALAELERIVGGEL